MKQATKTLVPPVAFTEVEQELTKMRKVGQDIRLVLEKILSSNDIDRSVSQNIVDDLLVELQLVIARVKQLPIKSLPTKPTADNSENGASNEPNTQRITEHGSDSEIGSSARRQRKVMLSDMYDLNQELTEENDFLAKKLEYAEDYIRKVELQNGLLTNEISALRIESKSVKEEVSFDKRSKHSRQPAEVERLRQDLRYAEEFIARNNEYFVKYLQVASTIIQKYNERIWKLESELDQCRNKLYYSETQLHYQQVVLSKMREDNIQLEVLSRNFRGFIGEQPEREYRLGRNSPSRRSSKIKDFFKEKIQESLRRKQSN